MESALGKHSEDVRIIAEDVKAIWAKVLDVRDLGLDDHFLDLGGDSLGAMLCASDIRDAFGVDLTLNDFFYDEATVSNQALLILAERDSKESA